MKCLRVFARLGPVLLILTILLSACAGEAFVTYEGTVTAGPSPSLSFDGERNPVGLPAIEGAAVRISICIDSCPGDDRARTVATDENGNWGPVDRSFGGLLGSTSVIQIEFTADGYEPLVYETVFETTSDPLDGELFLNATLVEAAG